MKNSRTLNSIKNASVNLISRIVTLIAGFLIRTIFLKYLGDQYTGVSTLFTDILHILSFTELGMGTAISFAFYKPVAEKNHYRIAQLMKLCKYIYTAISCSILILGIAFIPFLNIFVKDVPDIKESIVFIYILYVLKTALSYLLIYKSTLLIANQKQYIVTSIEGCCTLVKTVVEVILLISYRNFMLYLYFEIVSTLITNLIISRFANKEQNFKGVEVQIKREDFKELFKNVKDVFIYKVNGIILNSTDSLVISNAISTSAVAYMSNYNLLFNAISNIVFQVISAMTASVGNMAIFKSDKEQKKVFYTINFLCYCFTSVIITGLWLCTNSFIEIIFGKKYVLSKTIVLLLCLNLFIVNMHMIVDMFRTANGIFHKGRMRPLATAIINVVVSIIAVRFWGLAGVLFGTVVSRISTQLWYDSKIIFNLVFNESVKQYYKKYLLYISITCICCYIGSAVLNKLNFNVYILFLIGFIFAIAFNILILFSIFWKTEEFKNTLEYLKVLLRR